MAVSVGHIIHMVKMSVSGYCNRLLKRRLHQYIVSLTKTLNFHCFSRLRCEISTTQKHLHEEHLLSAISFPEEIALKNQNIFMFTNRTVCYRLQCFVS